MKTTKKLEKLMGETLSFGLLLRSIRQGEEMTQAEFSKILGVSTQYLCDIENERRFVSPKVAATFAKKTGYSEKNFVSICLQDLIDREGLNLTIHVDAA